MRLLVDTNRFSDLTANNYSAHDLLESAAEIWFSTITLGELLAGFFKGTRQKENEKQLFDLLDLQGVGVLIIDRQTTEYYATIWYALYRQGTPIPTNDIWIAAQALQHDLTLDTHDQHFPTCSRIETRVCQRLKPMRVAQDLPPNNSGSGVSIL